jgi:hypothetical protein
MMSISFFDLFPESVEAVGEVAATIWFFIGAAFFALIVTFIPEPDSSSMVLDVADDDEGSDMGAEQKQGSTGASTGAEPHPSTAVRRSTRARRWASELWTTACLLLYLGTTAKLQAFVNPIVCSAFLSQPLPSLHISRLL